jgi:hypothetical protein
VTVGGGLTARQRRRAGVGGDMRIGALNARPDGSRVRELAIADQATGISGSRRARLMSASALAGGTLRCLAVAAGMVTIFGTPAAASCRSATITFHIPGGVGGGGGTDITLPFAGILTDVVNSTACNADANGEQCVSDRFPSLRIR